LRLVLSSIALKTIQRFIFGKNFLTVKYSYQKSMHLGRECSQLFPKKGMQFLTNICKFCPHQLSWTFVEQDKYVVQEVIQLEKYVE
jgi:hypothetical protein